MGLTREQFYDESQLAIIPMGFCFPGLDAKGGDLPPRPECAPKWRQQVFERLPNLELTLVIGAYAQKWHLGERRKGSVTATVEAWRSYLPEVVPMPHPSWRNTSWLKKHPWFEDEVVPYLRQRISNTTS